MLITGYETDLVEVAMILYTLVINQIGLVEKCRLFLCGKLIGDVMGPVADETHLSISIFLAKSYWPTVLYQTEMLLAVKSLKVS